MSVLQAVKSWVLRCGLQACSTAADLKSTAMQEQQQQRQQQSSGCAKLAPS
jgi:hypothetical protein